MTAAKSAASVPRSSAARSHRSMRLRLYVAGRGPNSLRALDSLRTLMASMAVPPRLEIIDVLESPGAALKEGILVTPTLVRLAPGPQVRVIGDLTDRARVLSALGLSAINPAS